MKKLFPKKLATALFAVLLGTAVLATSLPIIVNAQTYPAQNRATLASSGNFVGAYCQGNSSADIYVGSGLTGVVTVYTASNLGTASAPSPGPTASPFWSQVPGVATYATTLSSFPGTLHVQLGSSPYVFAVLTTASGGSATGYINCSNAVSAPGAPVITVSVPPVSVTFPTFPPYLGTNNILTGPSTAPAASAGAYVATVNSSGQLTMVCASGCSGGAAATPGAFPSTGQPPTAAPPVVAQGACAYNTGSIAVTNTNEIALQCTANGTLIVTTPAPAGTVFVANATTAPFATWVPVTIASAVALTVNTPAPNGTVFISNTPGVVCISGCSGGAAATPGAFPSTGQPPTAAPPVVSQGACAYNTGVIAVTNTNEIALQCTATGTLIVTTPAPAGTVFVANATTAPFATWVPVTIASSVALTVNTPAPVATIFVVNTPSVLVANTLPPTPGSLPSTGASPTAGAPVVAENMCSYNSGVINVTNTNNIAMQCTATGALIVTTPAPAGTVFVANPIATMFVVNTPGVLVFNTTPPTPGAFPSAGQPATAAPPVVAQGACSYNTGTIAPTNTDEIAMQCDSAGNLKVNCITGCSGGGGSNPTAVPQSTAQPNATAVPGIGYCYAHVGGNAGTTWDACAEASASPAPPGVLAQGFNAAGPAAPVICTNGVPVTTSTTAVVAAVSGKRIYVCAYALFAQENTASSTTAALLEYGTETSTPCDTGAVKLAEVSNTQGTTLTDESGTGSNIGTGVGLVTGIVPANNQLCIVILGSGTTFGTVMYEQF